MLKLTFFQGKLDLLPKDLRETIAEATSFTCNNTKCVLNVAFSYTSREEMTQAVKQVCTRVKDQTIQLEDISEELIEQCLYTHLSGLGLTPDLLIRTSGEKRLSDFLLWQTTYSVTHFTEVLWPDFSLRNFMFAIFYYQRRVQYRQSLLTAVPLTLPKEEAECKKGSCIELEKSNEVGSKIDALKKTEPRVIVYQTDDTTKSC
jgi:undecaprenyl diphosphate synthase